MACGSCVLLRCSLLLAAPVASGYYTPDPPSWSRREMLCALSGVGNVLPPHEVPAVHPESMTTNTSSSSSASPSSASSAAHVGQQPVHWNGPSLASSRLVHGPRRRCAVVSSSGVLQARKHGPEIDSADIVIRFNDAPTTDYEPNVGHKDVMRLMNNLFASKLLQNRSEVVLKKNVTYVVFPVSEQEILDTRSVQRLHPEIEFYSADMGLQQAVTVALRSLYPPGWFLLGQSGSDWVATTGAAGMLLALSICDEVRGYGMASSAIEHNYPYHYYDRAFAFEKSHSALLPWDWHADENFFHKTFSAEKDLWKRLSSTSPEEVEASTVTVIPGFRQLQCTEDELTLLSRVHPPTEFRFSAYPVSTSVSVFAAVLAMMWLVAAGAVFAKWRSAPTRLYDGSAVDDDEDEQGVHSARHAALRRKPVRVLLGYGLLACVARACTLLSAHMHDGTFLWNPVFTVLLIEVSKGLISIGLSCCSAASSASKFSREDLGTTPRSEAEKETALPLVMSPANGKDKAIAAQLEGRSGGGIWEAALRLSPVALCRVISACAIYASINLRHNDSLVRWRALAVAAVALLWMAFFRRRLPTYQSMAVTGVVIGSLLGSMHVLGCHGSQQSAALMTELGIAVAVLVATFGHVLNEDVLKRHALVEGLGGVDRLNIILFLETSLLLGAAVLCRTLAMGETVMFLYAGYDVTTVALIAAETFAGLFLLRALLHSSAVAAAVAGSMATLVEIALLPLVVMRSVDLSSAVASVWIGSALCLLFWGLLQQQQSM